MQTFDQSIFDHFQSGRVSYEEALRWASNAEDFKLKVQGVSSTSSFDTEESEEEPGAGGVQIERFSD